MPTSGEIIGRWLAQKLTGKSGSRNKQRMTDAFDFSEYQKKHTDTSNYDMKRKKINDY